VAKVTAPPKEPVPDAVRLLLVIIGPDEVTEPDTGFIDSDPLLNPITNRLAGVERIVNQPR
jgi:hypothetical protein